MAGSENVFKALLRYWRTQRGMSQLDLGLTADVSARHISFLETGRSRPSVEMVMLLAEVLVVPLRDRNDMLRAAGFEARYAEPEVDDLLAGPVGLALDVMLDHHDPFPVIVFNRCYDVVRTNAAASALLGLVGVDSATRPNLLRLMFDPALRPVIEDWDLLAGQVLQRAQRELINRPNDHELAELITELTPQIPSELRAVDLSEVNGPAAPLTLNLGTVTLSMLGLITTFSAPNNVTLDELQIESWIPMDDETRAYFIKSAASGN